MGITPHLVRIYDGLCLDLDSENLDVSGPYLLTYKANCADIERCPVAGSDKDQHRALAVQDKIYPLNNVLEVMDKLMALDTKSSSLDDAREYIKALAPWIKEEQIEYDTDMNPIGVSGAHTQFPPFHLKCRTTSSIL